MFNKLKNLFNHDGIVTNDDIINKKRIIIGVVVIGLTLCGILYSYFSYANRVKEYASKNKPQRKNNIVNEEDKKNTWQSYVESELNKLKDDNNKLKMQIEEQNKIISEYEAKKKENIIKLKQSTEKKSLIENNNVKKEVLEKYKDSNVNNTTMGNKEEVSKFDINLLPPPPATPTENDKKVLQPLKYTKVEKNNSGSNEKEVGIRVYKPAQEPATAIIEKPKKSIYIPSGSFLDGVLLSGLDAPTMQAGTSNPQPVLINVNKDAILPNNYYTDIVDCFLLGSGRGDLSSERAYIRLVKLSCIDTNKKVIDTEIEGWVMGEDGKVGLRGRLVSKQGTILAKALLAGFAEGVSKAFTSTASNISVTPEGSVSTIDPDKALQVAGYSGIGEAAKKLADFYMKMAESMFPVIEVGAGRNVTVVIKDGKELVLEDKKIVETINYKEAE